ncbi:uncharacterized protein PODANS_6_8991 [Podospora anserina S mat+]|uniref:Podospora anserina S mat+ genomic DNA chromosome 6, supercontig 4 n=1 Tax=Podospora anserina (strain S / ATCC MYA-4624 / DSM 980 / FGSC 10383) TaxID=515849 RepID=B2AN51_PODAN|nr:uncharacterized protein PODANS_6_8991 [Podospora anserina S mat+]CAP65395.1 unnamed protein product [Podospora anserina S mat+]CDP31390.1 Putative protein of unknown function [Podospora anserina S mat+]
MALVFLPVWSSLFLLRVPSGLGHFGLVRRLIIRLLPPQGSRIRSGRAVPFENTNIAPQGFPVENTNNATETKPPAKRKRQRTKKDAVPEPPAVRGDLFLDAASGLVPVSAGSKRRRGRPAVSARSVVPNAQSTPGLPLLSPAPAKHYGAGVLNGHDSVSSMIGARFASEAQSIAQSVPDLPVLAPAPPNIHGHGVLNGHDTVSSMPGAQFASEVPPALLSGNAMPNAQSSTGLTILAPAPPNNHGHGLLNGHDTVSSMLGAQFAAEAAPAVPAPSSNVAAGFLNGHDTVSSMIAAQIHSGVTPAPLPDLAATMRPSPRKRR